MDSSKFNYLKMQYDTILNKFLFIFARLCTDLQTLIHERAEIEKAYAKNLRAWSKKWADLIEKGNLFMNKTFTTRRA